MKKVLNVLKVLIIIILSTLLIVNISIIIQTKRNSNAVPNIFGYKPFIVLSGSMESKIKVGDLVIVKEIDSNKLKKEDIIAFRDSENSVTTHRIIEKNKEGCYKTKGDANNVEDKEIVCSKSIEGKYQFRISKLGNILLFIQKPLGFVVMIMSIVIIVLFIYLFSNNKRNKLDDKELEEFKEYKKMKSTKDD